MEAVWDLLHQVSMNDTINAALRRRAQFADFLAINGIKYRIGMISNRKDEPSATDSLTTMRIEFYLSGDTVSAIFSPGAIVGCVIETQGILDDGDPIRKWQSVEELQDFVLSTLY